MTLPCMEDYVENPKPSYLKQHSCNPKILHYERINNNFLDVPTFGNILDTSCSHGQEDQFCTYIDILFPVYLLKFGCS